MVNPQPYQAVNSDGANAKTRLAKPHIYIALVVALTIAPFTSFRFFYVGAAEILIGVVFIRQCIQGLTQARINDFILTRFWLAFLTVSVIGMAVNAGILENSTSTNFDIGFDLAAYVFILITCFTFEHLTAKNEFSVPRFTRYSVILSGVVFSLLFFLSFFSASLFGFKLTYYHYFVPLAENLHQTSTFLVPLPFLGIAALADAKRSKLRWLIAALIPLFGVMAIATGSSKATLSIIVGSLVLGYFYFLRQLGRETSTAANILAATAILTFFLTSEWVAVLTPVFERNDLSSIRSYLYGYSVEVILQSPIVGRGPGPHLDYFGQFVDAHQTLITVALQSGLIGAAMFIALIVSGIRRSAANPALLAALASILAYSAGGDILRRLPVWVMLFIIFHYSQGGTTSTSSPSKLSPKPRWQLAAPKRGSSPNPITT